MGERKPRKALSLREVDGLESDHRIKAKFLEVTLQHLSPLTLSDFQSQPLNFSRAYLGHPHPFISLTSPASYQLHLLASVALHQLLSPSPFSSLPAPTQYFPFDPQPRVLGLGKI